jgi:hypothetical protein
MDVYRYRMSRYLRDKVFSPCRGKAAIIVRLCEIVAELCDIPENPNESDLVLGIGKFQRIFLISEAKIFSLHFPFVIQQNSNRSMPNIFTVAGITIDSYILSRIVSIVSENFLEIERNIYEFADSVTANISASPNEGSVGFSDDVWIVLKRLLMIEDGYFRYDNDPKNFDEVLHPLDHLDIFYTPGCTFKVGLDKRLNHELLVDILDPKTRCRILGV